MAKTKDTRTYADHQRQLAAAVAALPPLTVLEGEESFLRAQALRALLAAFRSARPGAAEMFVQGGGDGKFDFPALLEEMSGAGLFASDKIIIIRNVQKDFFPEKMASEGKTNPWQMLAERLDALPENVFCIVEVDKINAARVLGKALNRGTVVPCPLMTGAGDVFRWLQTQARAQGMALDRGAAELLQTTYGANLGALAGELEKLALFTSGGEAVTLDIVRQFMPDNEEFNSFELLNALEARNRRQALHFARLITGQGSRDQGGKLQSADTSAHIALSTCSQRFEQLLRVRMAVDGGASPAAVAERLRLPPWQAQKLCEAARRFSFSELARILETIADAIAAAHDTGADVAISLEKIVLAVCPK